MDFARLASLGTLPWVSLCAMDELRHYFVARFILQLLANTQPYTRCGNGECKKQGAHRGG